MYQPVFDKQRFKALMLYLAHENRESETFGLTKLSKLLYYCDTRAYVRTGKSITGSEYLKEKRGPLPKYLYEVMREMKAEGAVKVETRPAGVFSQSRLVPLVPITEYIGEFSEAELETIDETNRSMRGMTGAQVTEYSHGEVGWRVTPEREPIPYESAYFVSANDLDANELIEAVIAEWERN